MAGDVRSRMLDAALPYVCGRRLQAYGLDEPALAALQAWADDSASRSVTVSLGRVDVDGDLVLLLLPGVTEVPELGALKAIEVQYAFEVPGKLAADTAAPTLPADQAWVYARQAAGIWLDVEKPKQPLGCFVVATKELA